MLRIIIAGGGFSGAMTLANLIRHATAPLNITLAEPSGCYAQGAAYGTTDPLHLLNVRAGRMGAVPDAVDGFLRWLQADTSWRHDFPNLSADANAFMPRMLYGRYIASLFAEAVKHGTANGHQITLLPERITRTTANNSNELTVAFEKSPPQTADHLVLATGNAALTPAMLTHLEGAEGFIGNVWDAASLSAIQHWPRTEPVAIMGTGLTAVDMILTLAHLGFSNIVAFSRNGLLPAAHTLSPPLPAPEWATQPGHCPGHALDLLRNIRHACRKVPDWRSVIDGLRQQTPALWAGLSEQEKRRFFHHLFTFWNIHRHRMPESSAETLSNLQQRGALRILKARLGSAEAEHHALKLTLHPRKAAPLILSPARLIACTGPGYGIRSQCNPLLNSLLDANLITTAPLGMGIRLATDGSAESALQGRIHPIGPLRVESELETVAVPELRVQAQDVALRLLRMQ